MMVNAPINKGQDWEIMRKQLRQNILLKLSRILKEDIESLIEIEEYTDPSRLSKCIRNAWIHLWKFIK